MYTDYQKIRSAIERALNAGKSSFIIYPYGEYGAMTKQILNDSFGIKEAGIIDNHLSQFNSSIHSLSDFKKVKSEYTVLFTCANPDVYEEVLNNLRQYFAQDEVIEIFEVSPDNDCKKVADSQGGGVKSRCGKYSYGPLCELCDNESSLLKLVEEVGAFSSFACGATVVVNHPLDAISTHPFLYWDVPNTGGYFPDVPHRPEIRRIKKSRIGNDVWLGQNVIITNGANIGNGVIAAAGAVITKDVPDYAVVAGVPARVIRYRFSPEQIKALNKIAWWDWPDEKIREYYDDFFADVDVFIKKHENDE